MSALLPATANPDKVARLTFAAVMEPPPPIDLHSWACGNVVFGSDSPSPGAYNPAAYPWNEPILHALGPDDPCQEVGLKKSIQLGGTVLAQIFIAASLDQDPGPCMFVHPVDANAKRFVRTKWRPFIRNIKRLSRLLPERSRDAGASLDYQERADGRGFVQHSAATSSSALSQVSIKRQVQDDLDKWQSDGTTGDPEHNATGRCEAYLRAGTAKIFKVGNPVLKHNSRILRGWKSGSQERWHWECPHCQIVHPHLEWEPMRDAAEADRQRFCDEGMSEEDAREAAAANAHIPCAGCEKPIRFADWLRLKGTGCFVAENPRALRRKRWFYVWSAFVDSWSTIVRKYWDAKGNPEAEQTFLNEVVGEGFEAAGEAPPWEAIRDRAHKIGHDLGTIPEGGLILVISVDCQGDRVECHVKAFGAGLRRWTVFYKVIPGHIREETTRAGLDALLEQTWPNAFGHRRKAELLVIDAGAYKADVEGWVQRHSPKRVWMVRGSKDQFAPDLVMLQSRNQRRAARAVTGRAAHTIQFVGAAVIKGQLYGCLLKDDPLAPGYCGYPRGLDDEFYRQLCSEKRAKRKGTENWFWDRVYTANEVLDTEVYAQAAAVALGWKRNTDQRWEELRQRWETPADPTGQADLFAAPAADPDEGAPTLPEAEAANAVRPPAPPAPPAVLTLADRFAALNNDDED
ncbi:terminase gpA endonuclease subunit [Azospirillum picis]|uniref:Phage terminase large subunit GpA-like protein n=1 Tax=Azospirillum picis TaxID=488438 RepID=A0ABU0MUH1_9PROT|nr:terminase gpA endonuclease subunit [Azospirillum picis]MBP2303316.1 phage terminase large subunit GpA-like protein [Azospirillum picis]MDQ0537144.1 phage terminase large subunit GpA-like protein [Azospirillum picis]